MRFNKILIVDDDSIIRKVLEEQLRSYCSTVVSSENLVAAKTFLNKNDFDLIFLDIHLQDGNGVQLLQYLNELPNSIEKPLVIIITGFGSIQSAVECMKLGAFDYILKPFSLQEIKILLEKAKKHKHLLSVNQFFSKNDDLSGCLLGESLAIQRLRNLIEKVAPTEATVLITGENGTGKELVAHEIFRKSHLSNKPYITVNCAAISEHLIESEFFGHEKGAFTHAVQRHIGRFELANEGTILLDEVAEISPRLQVKLLRVLQEKEFERVGGSQTLKINVRVIASTNQNLQQAIKNNTFRQDLYYRLNVFPIEIPPLRDRKQDILILADFFLKRYSKKYNVHLNDFSKEAKQKLPSYGWPGNVRELQNVIERSVILSKGQPTIASGLLDVNI